MEKSRGNEENPKGRAGLGADRVSGPHLKHREKWLQKMQQCVEVTLQKAPGSALQSGNRNDTYCPCHFPPHWFKIPHTCNVKKQEFILPHFPQAQTQKLCGRRAWAEESCSHHVGLKAERKEGAWGERYPSRSYCSNSPPDQALPPDSKSALVPMTQSSSQSPTYKHTRLLGGI